MFDATVLLMTLCVARIIDSVQHVFSIKTLTKLRTENKRNLPFRLGH